MVYGTGTRSYNRSTEARTMKKEREEATRKYEEQRRGQSLNTVEVKVACPCRYKPYPHHGHPELRHDWDWRPR